MLSETDMQQQFTQIYYRNVSSVYRVCYSYMKNKPEAEDMVQETFLRMITSGQTFENSRHEKAWLIVTAANLCKDTLKKWWRKHEDLDDYANILPAADPKEDSAVEAVLNLPPKYKDVVYLYYYEGYSTAEIARHLKSPEATVRSRLSRARTILKDQLGGELE